MEKRVVITGLGAITPIGNDVEEFWKNIKEGKCGIDKITKFDTTDFKVKIAGEVKGYNPEDYFERREAKRLDLFSQYAIVASSMERQWIRQRKRKHGKSRNNNRIRNRWDRNN